MPPPPFNPMDLAGAVAELAAAYLSGDAARKRTAKENYQRVRSS